MILRDKGRGFRDMPGSPRKEREEFPVKATGTQKARLTNQGKTWG
jgi:hypothetical protein